MDHEAYRARSREGWEGVAAGWGARRAEMAAATREVSAWLVEAIAPQPGHAVLELACGAGDTGLLATELVRPAGRLIATDGAEAMVELVRTRAEELGLSDVVEAKAMEAEWIDLDAASVDGVLCRWGYMLLADPGAALGETRRVLRPGGRVALAAWASATANPWSFGPELARFGLADPGSGEPGPFAWSDTAVIAEALRNAGFVEPEVQTIDFGLPFDDLDAWFDYQYDLSPSLGAGLAQLTPEQRDELRDAAYERVAEHVAPDGRVRIPASTHVATASA